MLKVVPQEPGKIKITQIQWDLFEKFKCKFDFSSEKKLSDCSRIFQYSVEEQSSEITASIQVHREMNIPLIYNETTTGRLIMKPSRPIKNLFLICSHSHVFGFQTCQISDEQASESDIKIDLKLRATKIGDLNVKFLARYEVVDA